MGTSPQLNHSSVGFIGQKVNSQSTIIYLGLTIPFWHAVQKARVRFLLWNKAFPFKSVTYLGVAVDWIRTLLVSVFSTD